MWKGEMSGTVGGGHSLSPREFLAENLWQVYTYPASHAQINMQTSDSLGVWTRSVGNSRLMLMPVHHFSNRPNSHESAEAAYGPRLKSYWPENAFELTLAEISCLLYIFEHHSSDLNSQVDTCMIHTGQRWYIYLYQQTLCWGKQQTANIWSNTVSRLNLTLNFLF